MSHTSVDTFAGTAVRAITQTLRPRGSGWSEVNFRLPHNNFGFPSRTYEHRKSGLVVISSVETMSDEDKGPEFHISISLQRNGRGCRCDSNTAKWVLDQFGLDGAEEDNHVPGGIVRNFWRTVAAPLIGMECECKEAEPAIVEDKGDFVWRAAP